MIDEKTKRAAVLSVLGDLRVRLTCRHDPERCGRIADTVWGTCSDVIDNDKLRVGDRKMLAGVCGIRVEQRPDYKDAVSFIPMWLVAILLKVIISLLIEWWINYEKGPSYVIGTT